MREGKVLFRPRRDTTRLGFLLPQRHQGVLDRPLPPDVKLVGESPSLPPVGPIGTPTSVRGGRGCGGGGSLDH
jgi:hypothetical protein